MEPCFLRRWLSHWLAAILFSLILFFGLKLVEPGFLLRALDRAGSDAVMQGYSPTPTKNDPRVVVVDLGADPTAAIVADTLNVVVQAHPKGVGIDARIAPALHDDLSKTGPQPISMLVAALRNPLWGITPIALPVDNNDLKNALKFVTNIRSASVDLSHDEDGVVRSVKPCRDAGASTKLLTLAAAVLALDETVCDSDDGPLILFAPIDALQDGDKGGVFVVARETVALHPSLLDKSYVLLGTAGQGMTGDRFRTPVGELPGVVIHAQSIWTMGREGTSVHWDRHREFLAAILDLGVAAFVGAFFSVYAALRHGDEGPITSVRQATLRFAEGVAVVAGVVVVLIFVGVCWTWLAVSFVGSGVMIGAMSAMFGVMLENLAHAGILVVSPVQWVIEKSLESGLKRKSTTIMLVILCFPQVGHAAGCPYKMTVQPPLSQDWSVEPSAFGHHDANGTLQPFDRIVVKQPGTTVTVNIGDASDSRSLTVTGVNTGSGAVLILPPCPPRTDPAGAWHRFWAAMNARESTEIPGAVVISRGLETGELAGKGRPLRELASLGPAEGTVQGTKGLAFAWAGGSPPYRLAIEDEATGAPLGRARTTVSEVWLADWRTPQTPFVVIVTDSQGVTLGRHLHPLAPLPAGGNELDDAVTLFEITPTYRLEALRQMFVRSNAGDGLATRAIALVRMVGTPP